MASLWCSTSTAQWAAIWWQPWWPQLEHHGWHLRPWNQKCTEPDTCQLCSPRTNRTSHLSVCWSLWIFYSAGSHCRQRPIWRTMSLCVWKTSQIHWRSARAWSCGSFILTSWGDRAWGKRGSETGVQCSWFRLKYSISESGKPTECRWPHWTNRPG